jgi:UDP-2,4-diacetamido-2,4,6-trideoxy-beta-L-altropyranose hydrolase
MGTGHVMRCLALAQAWRDAGGTACFAVAEGAEAVEGRLAHENASVRRITAPPGGEEDARQLLQAAGDLGAGWLVVDGYRFGAEYQRALKEAGARLLVIDDYGHAGHYHADLVLNQNLYADEGLYARRDAHTRLLLGPRYVLLGREFTKWRGRGRDVPAEARKVLVTLGGSDPDNVTLRAVGTLQTPGCAGLEAVVVVGAGNPHRAAVQAAVKEPRRVRLRVNVTDMPELMAWADFALAAAGSTCWELALMGLPGLLVVSAENQAPVAASCAAAGVGRDLGWQHGLTADGLARSLQEMAADRDFRSAAARRGPELIDGRGAERVVSALLAGSVRLREAGPDDCRLVWQWANEPSVRAASFNPEPIPWEGHRAWFAGKLADANCLFFIVEADGQGPLGQVRCDLSGEQAVISIALAPDARGKGLGTRVIREACARALQTGRVRSVLALVRAENEPSRAAFLRAGFVEDGETVVRGCPALRLVFRP